MNQKTNLRSLLPLLGLTVSAFIFNTSEFIPIGLLSDIAAAFGLSEAGAGIMITVYSWAVTILSLPLMLLVCKIDFRRLLLLVIGLFGIGQLLSALAPSFIILILARFLVACAHAVFWSIASPIAVQTVPEEKQTFALSMIITGTSVAMILGMPLGRIIGLSLGWRMTFALMALITLAVFLYMLFLFPRLAGAQSFTLAQLPALLKNPILRSIYIFIALIVTGYYAGYSYIEPFLSQVAKLSAGTATIALSVFGIAGLLGSFLFSKLYGRTRLYFLMISSACLCAALYLMYPAAMLQHNSMFALCAFWGVAATAFNVAFQSELIAYTPKGASAIAMSIYSGIFNLGIGLGTGLGGLVSENLSLNFIGLVGGIAASIAVLFCIFYIVPLLRRTVVAEA